MSTAAQAVGIARDVNCLQDDDRNTRRRSLERIRDRLLGGGALGDGVSEQQVADAVVDDLVPGCLRIFETDGVERNRESSLAVLEEAMQYLRNYQGGMALPRVVEPIVSCLARRMGSRPDASGSPLESSEEIRLGGMKALERGILRGCDGPEVLSTVCEDVVGVIERGMYDTFHEVKKAACSCAVAAADSGMFLAGGGAMAQNATRLVKACLGGVLSHQHHRVRQSGVKALGRLLLRGGGAGQGAPASLPSIKEDIVPALSVLVQDRQAVVRRTLCSVVAEWLKSDGLVGDEGHVAMMPVVISCITDDTPDVVRDAQREIEEIGAAWAKTHAACAHGSEDGADDGVMEVDVGGAAAGARCGEHALPPPYDQRAPGDDVRRMVGSSLGALLPPMLRGLQEWTVHLRKLYARQLKAVTMLAGRRSVPFLDRIVPALAMAVGDENDEIAEICINAAHIVACTCPARRWVDLAVDCLAGGERSVGQQTSALTLLAALLYGARDGGIGADEAEAIVAALSLQEVRGVDDPKMRLQLLVVMKNLTRSGSPALLETSIARRVFLVLLQLTGQENDELIRRDARGVIESLSLSFESAAGAGEIEDAVAATFSYHAPALLQESMLSDGDWNASSPQFQIFQQLLFGCPSVTLREVLPLAVPSMYKCAGEDRDPALRIAILRVIDTLAEGKDAVAVTEPVSRALMELAMLTAVWRAGKTAAAIRYSAIVAMGTLVRRGLCDKGVLLELISSDRRQSGPAPPETSSGPVSLLPIVITCMDEDFYVDTRRASCYLCEQILSIAGQPALSDEQRRQLYPALLKRLDDSSDDVRIAACSVLAEFFRTLPGEYDDTNTGYLLKGMLLHMDDANKDVQEAVCQAAIVAAGVKGAAVSFAIEEAKRKHRSAVYCDRVMEAIAE